MADAVAKATNGGDVGVIVWGVGSLLAGLEVYDLGAGDDHGLPIPESIAAW